jgi:hypothetical protein
MQDALPIVIIAVVAVAAVIGVVLAARGKGVYDDIRAGDFVRRPDPPAARDAEIAQMRAALAARRASQGDAPVAPSTPIDDDLRAEVRALVEARNARRAARGEPPLDVEAEVERRLSELDG